MDCGNTTRPTTGLLIEFANPRGTPLQLGPFAYLRFEGELLVTGPSGLIVAEHVDHRWVLKQGGTYSRLDCDARVLVHFYATERLQSKTLGPFDFFSCIDGVAYANRRVMAFCDRQLQDWYSYHSGSHWKVLIVEPAPDTPQ